MKQAIALGLCTLLVGTVVPLAEAQPKRTPRQVVAVPRLPLSRRGGLPSFPVDRGMSRSGDRAITPASLFHFRRPVPAVPAAKRSPRSAPARAQVLALRERVRLRYKGHGLGSHLAWEIP